MKSKEDILNGFIEEHFLNLFKKKIHSSQKEKIFYDNKNSFPYILAGKDKNIFLSFPCLSGPKLDNKNFEEKFTEFLKKEKIEQGYFLVCFNAQHLFEKNLSFEFKKKKIKIFSLNLKDIKLQNFRRDTRYALNKSIRKFKIKFSLTKNNKNIHNFLFHYGEISNQGKFSQLYRFKKEEIIKLLKSKLWKLSSLYILNEGKKVYLGGCILCLDKNFNYVDQTFLSYNKQIENSSRRTIYETANFFKKYFSRYNLGGGITEDDSLSKFKLGFSPEISLFTKIFFCKKNSHLIEKFKNFEFDKKWPEL